VLGTAARQRFHCEARLRGEGPQPPKHARKYVGQNLTVPALGRGEPATV
jgi:hypothetical protein